MQVFIAHATGGVFTDGLEHADDIQVFSLVMARQYGAAVHIDGRYIGAQHAHQAAGHVLVTPAQHQHAVHPLALDTGFDAVCNHFAADQAVFHALGAHGHAVRDGRCAKNLRIAPGLFNAGNSRIGQLLQAAVTRRNRAVAIGNADHGFLEVAFGVAHAVVHRTIRRARLAFGDVLAARVHDDGFGVHGSKPCGIGLVKSEYAVCICCFVCSNIFNGMY